jgi:glycosyltransferase involved in cell wall biosynthesis
MGRSAALHLLVVHSALGWRENEGGEIADLIVGLRRRVAAEGGQLLATNGRALFRVEADGDDVGYTRVGGLSALIRARVDAAHVHMVSQVRHLLVALLLRLRGVPVLLSPMGMLGDDFAGSSWFRTSGRLRRRAKPVLVRALRGCWSLVATAFVCTSAHEAQQARLSPSRVVLVPLPAPRSPLAARALSGGGTVRSSSAGPVAYVGRFDVHRKGIDRLAGWLQSRRDELPRPALRLFAPAGEQAPRAIAELIADGVIDWDMHTTGADLAAELERCRAMILLTRYEGQPRVLREAVLLGLPVITAAAANFSEALAVLDAGIVVDPDRPDQIQDAFEAVTACRPSPAAAAVLFDRDRLGSFVHDVLTDLAHRRGVQLADYYAGATPAHSAAHG